MGSRNHTTGPKVYKIYEFIFVYILDPFCTLTLLIKLVAGTYVVNMYFAVNMYIFWLRTTDGGTLEFQTMKKCPLIFY